MWRATGTRKWFWSEFAITMLHEYRHAVDMFNCQCTNPWGSPAERDPYEKATEALAQADYARLFGSDSSCLNE